MIVITIGRDPNNDIVIADDPHASRHHLQIIQHDDGRFTLKDFGSTNGTTVNGKRVTGEVPLDETDVVRIGSGNPIPWRAYFNYDDQAPLRGDCSSQNIYPSASSTPTLTESQPSPMKKGWYMAFCVIALWLGADVSFWAVLYFGNIYLPLLTTELRWKIYESAMLICGLSSVVMSVVFMIKLFKKSS